MMVPGSRCRWSEASRVLTRTRRRSMSSRLMAKMDCRISGEGCRRPYLRARRCGRRSGRWRKVEVDDGVEDEVEEFARMLVVAVAAGAVEGLLGGATGGVGDGDEEVFAREDGDGGE